MGQGNNVPRRKGSITVWRKAMKRSLHENTAVISGSLAVLFVSGMFALIVYWATKPEFVQPGLQEHYADSLGMGYYLYVPEKYNTVKGPHPLIIHLHGSNAGGNGKSELLKVKAHGLTTLIDRVKSKDCLVLAPQTLGKWDTAQLDGLIDTVAERYEIDTSRIYLTGVSMGGQGAWSYALRGKHPVAALVPVCGYYFLSGEEAQKLSDTPIWLFHGDRDTAVDVSIAYKLMEQLEPINPDFRATIVPGGSHSLWNETYGDPALYVWLFQKSR